MRYLALIMRCSMRQKLLLIRDGVIAGSKHSAVVAAFGREYAKTGKIEPRYHQMLIEDFEWRQKADYDVF